MLAATPKRAIVLRVLNNLEAAYSQQRSRAVVWVVRLRLAFPELPASEVRRAAAVLGSCGAYAEGAEILERLAEEAGAAGAADADTIEAEARALRARTN
jgi:hypothetical protein